jgi:hypothetical protein
MADGEKNGVWGRITNRNLGGLVEQALYGTTDVVLSDADWTLAAVYGDTLLDEARSSILDVSGLQTAPRSVIAPGVPKTYYVRNNTTGGFAILVGTSAGTKVSVPAGFSTLVLIDGTHAWDLHSHISVSGELKVVNLVVSGNLGVTGNQTVGGTLTVEGDIVGDLTGTAASAVNAEHLELKTLAEIKDEIADDYNAAIDAAIDALPAPGTPTRASLISSIDTSDPTKKGFKDVAVVHFVYPENGTYTVFDLTGSGITAEQISITNSVGTGPGTITGSFTGGVFSVTIASATTASRNFKSTLWFWRTLGP